MGPLHPGLPCRRPAKDQDVVPLHLDRIAAAHLPHMPHARRPQIVINQIHARHHFVVLNLRGSTLSIVRRHSVWR